MARKVLTNASTQTKKPNYFAGLKHWFDFLEYPFLIVQEFWQNLPSARFFSSPSSTQQGGEDLVKQAKPTNNYRYQKGTPKATTAPNKKIKSEFEVYWDFNFKNATEIVIEERKKENRILKLEGSTKPPQAASIQENEDCIEIDLDFGDESFFEVELDFGYDLFSIDDDDEEDDKAKKEEKVENTGGDRKRKIASSSPPRKEKTSSKETKKVRTATKEKNELGYDEKNKTPSRKGKTKQVVKREKSSASSIKKSDRQTTIPLLIQSMDDKKILKMESSENGGVRRVIKLSLK